MCDLLRTSPTLKIRHSLFSRKQIVACLLKTIVCDLFAGRDNLAKTMPTIRHSITTPNINCMQNITIALGHSTLIILEPKPRVDWVSIENNRADEKELTFTIQGDHAGSLS